MPQPCFHLQRAQSLLDRWCTEAGSAPFSLSDRTSRTAFLHGALAPDMGFFPGTLRTLSELTHGARTGQLTQSTLRHARTDAEIAFPSAGPRTFGPMHWCIP